MSSAPMEREEILGWELYVDNVIGEWKKQEISKEEIINAEMYAESALAPENQPSCNRSDSEELDRLDEEENADPNINTAESPLLLRGSAKVSSVHSSFKTPGLPAAQCKEGRFAQAICQDSGRIQTGQKEQGSSIAKTQQTSSKEARKVSSASDYSIEIASPSFMRGGGGGERGSHLFDPDSTIPAHRSLQGERENAAVTPQEARCRSMLDHREAQSVRKLLRATTDGEERKVRDQEQGQGDEGITDDEGLGMEDASESPAREPGGDESETLEFCEGLKKLNMGEEERDEERIDESMQDVADGRNEEGNYQQRHAGEECSSQESTRLDASIDCIPDSEEEREEEEVVENSGNGLSAVGRMGESREDPVVVEEKPQGKGRVQVGRTGGSRMRRLYPAGPCVDSATIRDEEEDGGVAEEASTGGSSRSGMAEDEVEKEMAGEGDASSMSLRPWQQQEIELMMAELAASSIKLNCCQEVVLDSAFRAR
mmetsp:Transcript_6810/g.23928  ORF Transcript_6810/g.23928 Transcript_6810/m.23928 type:complete len:485 (-) Transcript_6810:1460-2914(-)